MNWTELTNLYTAAWDNGYFLKLAIAIFYFFAGAFWRYAYGKGWWVGAAIIAAGWLLMPLGVGLMAPLTKQGEVPTKAPTIYIHNFKLET